MREISRFAGASCLVRCRLGQMGDIVFLQSNPLVAITEFVENSIDAREDHGGAPVVRHLRRLERLDDDWRVRFVRDLTLVLWPLLSTGAFVAASRSLSNLPTEA